MKCDCCRKTKRLFESYEEIKFKNLKLHLCVNCSNELYKMRDLYNENKEEYSKCKNKIDKKAQKSTSEFSEWYEFFISGIEKKSDDKN